MIRLNSYHISILLLSFILSCCKHQVQDLNVNTRFAKLISYDSVEIDSIFLQKLNDTVTHHIKTGQFFIIEKIEDSVQVHTSIKDRIYNDRKNIDICILNSDEQLLLNLRSHTFKELDAILPSMVDNFIKDEGLFDAHTGDFNRQKLKYNSGMVFEIRTTLHKSKKVTSDEMKKIVFVAKVILAKMNKIKEDKAASIFQKPYVNLNKKYQVLLDDMFLHVIIFQFGKDCI